MTSETRRGLRGSGASVRDWSLSMGTGRGGGYKTRVGGACEVLPLLKGGGGGGRSVSHAEGGAQQVLG